MISAIKRQGIVGKEGKIEVCANLPEGTAVEIILLVEAPQNDETAYLLSSEANRQHLFEAIADVEKGENLVTISPEEWNEKYRI